MTKVSVIIPTYNRFKNLLNAIKSVKNQTYKNIEIIVINDCSTQKEYSEIDFYIKEEFGVNMTNIKHINLPINTRQIYSGISKHKEEKFVNELYDFDFKKERINCHDFYIINLPINSRQIFGKVAGGGNARNIGMMLATGDYIAFLDDDDYFLPTKIEKQILAMKENNCSMCCTEAYNGKGIYNPSKSYLACHYKGINWNGLNRKFTRGKRLGMLNKMFEKNINIWKENEVRFHNCCICSSMVIKKDLVNKAGNFSILKFAEDWNYWKRLIKYSNIVFIREPLTYRDTSHGGKRY